MACLHLQLFDNAFKVTHYVNGRRHFSQKKLLGDAHLREAKNLKRLLTHILLERQSSISFASRKKNFWSIAHTKNTSKLWRVQKQSVRTSRTRTWHCCRHVVAKRQRMRPQQIFTCYVECSRCSAVCTAALQRYAAVRGPVTGGGGIHPLC